MRGLFGIAGWRHSVDMNTSSTSSGRGARWAIWATGAVITVAVYAGIGAFVYAVGILLLSVVAGELVGRYVDQRRY